MPWLWLLLAAGVAGVGYVALSGDDAPPDRLPLDPNATPNEKKAVTFAFLYEKDPGNLFAFGNAMLPDLPIAAQTLLNQGAQKQAMLAVQAATGQQIAMMTSGLPGPLWRRFHPFYGGIPQHAGQSVGNIFELDNYTDFAGDTASGAWNVLTHPADTASGAWHAITHPADSFSDFVRGAVDALHAIPGMDEAGELLKWFAGPATGGFGEWCLRIMATYGYYVMAPYLGSGLAAISFALPGVAKAEPFLQAWIIETMDRVIATIAILLPAAGAALGAAAGVAANEALNKFLAENPAVQQFIKECNDEIAKVGVSLGNVLGPIIMNKIKAETRDAFDDVTKKLAAEFGYPPDFEKIAREATTGQSGPTIGVNVGGSTMFGGGVREDNAAAAYDLIAHTNFQATTHWDPLTGQDIDAHARKGDRFTAGLTPHFSIAAILAKPEREHWVDYYLTRARFAEGLAAADHAGLMQPLQPGGGFSTMPLYRR